MRKGFTLVELLIVAVVSAVVVLAIFSFFSFSYKKIAEQEIKERVYNQILDAVEVINSDLLKAGYGIENPLNTLPINWISEDRTLVIKYVDYDIPDCVNETFREDDDCSYKVTYRLKDDNLKRGRDEGDNNTQAFTFPIFDENVIKVEDFVVFVNCTLHRVDYTIKGKIKLREKSENFTISNSVICRNWKFQNE